MGYQDPKKHSLSRWRSPVILLVLAISLIVVPGAWILLFALLPVFLLQVGNRWRHKPIADAPDLDENSQALLVRQKSSTCQPTTARPIVPAENPPNVEERIECVPRLEGEALLAKIRSLPGLSKADLVRACGYIGRRKNGSERLDFRAFYEALLEAKGLQPGSHELAARPTRRPIKERVKGNKSFQVLVANEGSALLTKGWAAQLDLQPGDQFCVRLESGAIILDPVDPDEDAEADEPCWAGRRMHWHVTVDNENNILIPVDSLREIGLIPGQKLVAELGPATITLEPVRRSSNIRDSIRQESDAP